MVKNKDFPFWKCVFFSQWCENIQWLFFVLHVAPRREVLFALILVLQLDISLGILTYPILGVHKKTTLTFWWICDLFSWMKRVNAMMKLMAKNTHINFCTHTSVNNSIFFSWAFLHGVEKNLHDIELNNFQIVLTQLLLFG